MSAAEGPSTYFGQRYEAWWPDRQAAAEKRRRRRLERRAVRAEASAYKREQADLARAYKAKMAAARLAEKVDRDQQRGYIIDYKRIFMAYAAEGVIALTSACGQFLLARQYGTDSLITQQMMLAPIAYATVDMCRVPLALSVRSHRQWPIRLVALLGVIGAAGITAKSMSQLGNMLYSPRLNAVVIAREKLDLAQATDDQIGQRIAVVDALANQRRAEEQSAVDKEEAASSELAGLPAPRCHPASWFNHRAHAVIRTTVCTPDARGAALTSNLGAAREDTKNAQTAYEAALKERGALDRATADRNLADARAAYREAVRQSQLHDFVSMVFGVSPSEVTDGMVARFLRWFVFGSAICVAFASTMIAFTAITRVKRLKPDTIPLDDRHTEIILEPFAKMLLAEAKTVAEAVAEKVIAEAKAAVIADAEAKIARARKELDDGHPEHT